MATSDDLFYVAPSDSSESSSAASNFTNDSVSFSNSGTSLNPIDNNPIDHPDMYQSSYSNAADLPQGSNINSRYTFGVQQALNNDKGALSDDRTDGVMAYQFAAKLAGLSDAQIAQNIQNVEQQTDQEASSSNLGQNTYDMNAKNQWMAHRNDDNVTGSDKFSKDQNAQIANADLQHLESVLLSDKNGFKYDDTQAGANPSKVLADLQSEAGVDNQNIAAGSQNADSANSAFAAGADTTSDAATTGTDPNADGAGSSSDASTPSDADTGSSDASSDTSSDLTTDASTDNDGSDASSATFINPKPADTNKHTKSTATGKVNSHATSRTSKSGKQVGLYANKASIVKGVDKNGKPTYKVKLDAKTRADLDTSSHGGKYLNNSGKKGHHSQTISKSDFNKILEANGRKPLTNAQFEAALKSGKPLVNAKDNLAFNADVKHDGKSNRYSFDTKSISKSKYKFNGKNEKAVEGNRAASHSKTQSRKAFSSAPKKSQAKPKAQVHHTKSASKGFER